MKTLLWAGLIFFVCVAQADAEGFRIGVVDTERILRESDQAIRAKKKIEREFAARDQEIKKQIKLGKELQETLEKDGSTMSDSVRRFKERELANLNLNLQTMQREYREDLSLRQNEELTVVLARADKAIRAIAESEEYDVILQEAIYRNPRVDITDKVLKYLSTEIPEKSEK
jgi:outer membrane protein